MSYFFHILFASRVGSKIVQIKVNCHCHCNGGGGGGGRGGDRLCKDGSCNSYRIARVKCTMCGEGGDKGGVGGGGDGDGGGVGGGSVDGCYVVSGGGRVSRQEENHYNKF